MKELLKKAISSKAGDSFAAIRFSKTAFRALNGAVGDPLGFEAKGKPIPRPPAPRPPSVSPTTPSE